MSSGKTLFDRAARLQRAGDLDGAEEAYRSLLQADPRSVPVLVNLGALMASRGRFDESRGYLEQAKALAPGFHGIHGNLGQLALSLGEPAAAAAHLRAALALAPDNPVYHGRRGDALNALGRFGEAAACYRAALAIAPGDAKLHTRLGIALRRDGVTQEAIAAFHAALAFEPGLAAAHNGLGLALHDACLFIEAEGSFRRALALSPEVVEIHGNLGNSLRAQGRFAEALEAYEAGLALRPHDPELLLNRAVIRLGLGDFGGGWDDYEARWSVAEPTSPPRSFGLPVWRGEAIAQRGLLVYGEQGPGDVIMFASCLPEAMAAAARVSLQCVPTLVPLLARSFPGLAVESERLADGRWRPAPEGADLAVSIGSLPRFFRRSDDAFPRRPRYLATDPAAVARWRERLRGLGPGVAIGVSWRGGATVVERRLRGTRFDTWLPLLGARGAKFVNLQYGPRQGELKALSDAHGIHVADWPEAVEDLDAFAALIEALDLVISIANTTVHFAGAVGKITWALVPSVPSWRWMVERSDSPWYPSVELIRQEPGEDWTAVIARTARRLDAFIAEVRDAQGRHPSLLDRGNKAPLASATPPAASTPARRAAR